MISLTNLFQQYIRNLNLNEKLNFYHILVRNVQQYIWNLPEQEIEFL